MNLFHDSGISQEFHAYEWYELNMKMTVQWCYNLNIYIYMYIFGCSPNNKNTYSL